MHNLFFGMDMSTLQQIKKIIAVFLKVDPDSINSGTVIDRSAIKGSIMIHRMYAALSRDLNLTVKDYNKIRTLGDLLENCGLEAKEKADSVQIERNSTIRKENRKFSIGIDIEKTDKMPETQDYREDVFYNQNFSQNEISYCLTQPDPLQSFTGRFAAKEAIVKADNSYKGIAFSQIEIATDANGIPYFMNFIISISHTDNLAIAVAMKIPQD